ncbi:MAG: 1-hydroxycarotenoid 3,4-desaturase CrtD [Pseudomonadota bacterium]
MRPTGAALRDRVLVVGAGIGGLTTALELAHHGFDVTVFDQASGPGGKMRQVPSAAGPLDAGPTVFTMRWVFEALFDAIGERLEDHVTLTRSETLARHAWADGTRLDLFADPARSEAAVADAMGGAEAARFAAFTRRANLLFDAFDAPVMQAAAPTPLSVTRAVMGDAMRLLPAMAPASTLWSALGRQFRDPRLRQLFARYATYVGGSPLLSPAILMLIWASEQRGVWLVDGGMHALARALERLGRARGVRFVYDTPVSRITVSAGQVTGLRLHTGEHVPAPRVVFNGDPAALSAGLLGDAVRPAVRAKRPRDRSLSAFVWTYAPHTSGFPLAHHTVFFGDSSKTEFGDIFRAGRLPRQPTLYLCAQDRREAAATPQGAERILMIMNAPANGDTHTYSREEVDICQTTVFTRLRAMGLTMTLPEPQEPALTTPAGFARLFPGTGGALYGANPHGPLKTFSRPTAVTRITGLTLAGGGAHPGPGVPMSTLSGRRAAAAILADRASTSSWTGTGMPGGTLTGSAATGATASRSSGS